LRRHASSLLASRNSSCTYRRKVQQHSASLLLLPTTSYNSKLLSRTGWLLLCSMVARAARCCRLSSLTDGRIEAESVAASETPPGQLWSVLMMSLRAGEHIFKFCIDEVYFLSAFLNCRGVTPSVPSEYTIRDSCEANCSLTFLARSPICNRPFIFLGGRLLRLTQERRVALERRGNLSVKEVPIAHSKHFRRYRICTVLLPFEVHSYQSLKVGCCH